MLHPPGKKARRATICQWKQHFATWDEAEAACWAILEEGKLHPGGSVLAYRCDQGCESWHVGHVPPGYPKWPREEPSRRTPKALRVSGRVAT